MRSTGWTGWTALGVGLTLLLAGCGKGTNTAAAPSTSIRANG